MLGLAGRPACPSRSIRFRGGGLSWVCCWKLALRRVSFDVESTQRAGKGEDHDQPEDNDGEVRGTPAEEGVRCFRSSSNRREWRRKIRSACTLPHRIFANLSPRGNRARILQLRWLTRTRAGVTPTGL